MGMNDGSEGREWLSAHLELYSTLLAARENIHLMLIEILRERICRAIPFLAAVSWMNRDTATFEFRLKNTNIAIKLPMARTEKSYIKTIGISLELMRRYDMLLFSEDETSVNQDKSTAEPPFLMSREQLLKLIDWTGQYIELVGARAGHFYSDPQQSSEPRFSEVASIAAEIIDAAASFASVEHKLTRKF